MVGGPSRVVALLVLWAVPVMAQTYPTEREPLTPPDLALQMVTFGALADQPRDVAGDVRMLYLWSPSAAGSITAPTWAASQALVNDNNAAYARSGITSGHHTLVASAVIPLYVENETTGGLPWMIQIVAQPWTVLLRNLVGADCVRFITRDRACGQAYRPASSSTCYAQSHEDCIPNYTDIHEGGHNAFANHDRQNASCGASCTGDAYGHAYVPGVKRTVMVYPSPAGGERMPRFSNPLVLDDGVPTGVAGVADNARNVNAWLPTLAAFRADVNTLPIPFQLTSAAVARP